MCGRFTLRTPTPVLIQQFQLGLFAPLPPRYNIAPTQPIAVVRQLGPGEPRQLDTLRWGLIPSWAKDPAIGNRMINARAETVAEKPAYRAAFRQRRCLVLADGFYEWQKSPAGKQPYYIRLADDRPFAFAGLWERWQDKTLKDAPIIESCTVITTDANRLVQPIHDRMPAILAPEDYAHWLDPHVAAAEQLTPLLRPYPAEEMTTYPVSPLVNRPTSDSPECIKPQPEQRSLF